MNSGTMLLHFHSTIIHVPYSLIAYNFFYHSNLIKISIGMNDKQLIYSLIEIFKISALLG